MVAFGQRAHVGADIDHHTGPLMAQYGGKQTFRIRTGQCVFVGMANACGFKLDQHLTFPGSFELHGFNAQWFAGLEGHGSANVQDRPPQRFLL